MSSFTSNHEENVVTINIFGDFGSSDAGNFMMEFKKFPTDNSYRLDLKECTSLDSSALGAFLILKEHCDNNLVLLNAKDNQFIFTALTTMKIDRILTIE